jgi:Dehydrogenases with different specificities (related to short-chain alcohol dehydrogenases)
MQGSALVTGAATRIGKAIALGLASEGVNVAIHYSSSEAEAKEVASKAMEMKVKACLVKADLLKDEEVEGLVSNASNKLNEPLNI